MGDSTSVKCPQQANPGESKQINGCQGLAVGSGSDCSWGWVSILGDEDVLELDSGEYTKNH